MSTVKANTYQDAAGGSNAILYGVASPPNSMGFRNRIINGDMRIDQRNAGASVTPAELAYTLDRWQARLTQASKYSVQRNAGSVTPPTGFTNYLGVTSLSAYSVIAGDYFNIQQNIEGFNVADLGWGAAGAQSVTLSFWVRSSLTGTFGGCVGNANFNRSYPFTYTISAANTWEQKTITIAGDTTGTWATGNTNGLALYFGLGVSSTYSGTAGAWAGSGFLSATGATSVVGTNGATFYITGVQLEAGSVATPFERRDYGRELMMCQRYYNNNFQYIGGSFYSASQLSSNPRFPVTMRAAPTMSLSSGSTVDYSAIGVGGGTITPTFDSVTTLGCRMYGGSGSASLGSPFHITSSTIQASAEL